MLSPRSSSLPPRFSVVCAAYNAQATVVRAISSCLDQTYPPHEVIVVDDGSTDGTAALLLQTFGDRIVLVQLKENRGPSAARNIGLALATGDFVALQDADDYWVLEKLKRVAEAVQASGEINFIFHSYAHARAAQLGYASAKRFSGWRLLLRNHVATPCAIFRNNATTRFDEGLRWMEDWDFFLRLEERWGAWVLDEELTILGRPILSPGGLSAARWSMRRAEMRVYAKWATARGWRIPLLPMLWLWSLAKAARKSLLA